MNEWMNDRMTDRRTIKGRGSGDCGWKNRALATKRSPTARVARAARLRLAWLAWLALRARNQALAFGSRDSRFALATMRSPTARAARASPKCTKSPNLIFFLGISTQKLYQSTKILGQSTKILCQNTKILYQNFFYQSYVPKSQIWIFFFLGRTCILYSKKKS